jgi:hypothetical protein
MSVYGTNFATHFLILDDFLGTYDWAGGCWPARCHTPEDSKLTGYFARSIGSMRQGWPASSETCNNS